MGKIESDFIRRLQPSLCPSGINQKGSPSWCMDNPAPVDLDRYRSTYNVKSYWPYNPPPAVRFCSAFKALSAKGLCHYVDSGVGDELSGMINAPKKNDGVWPDLPTETQIARKLSKAAPLAPPGIAARLELQLKARAKKIRDGIIEARRLDDKGKKEEARKKREDLEEELKSVCITDDGQIKLERTGDDCKSVLDRYQQIKSSWIDGKKWFAAKLAVAAGVLWGLAKTGVLKKMTRAFKERWKATKPAVTGGPVKTFFKNAIALPGRILKSAWAAIRAKENIQPAVAPAPKVSQPLPSDTGIPLAIKPDAPESQVRSALGKARAAIGTILSMKDRVDSTLSEWLGHLAGLNGSSQDARAQLEIRASALRNTRALNFVRSLAARFERRFFNETVPDSLHILTMALGLIKDADVRGARQLLEGNEFNLLAADAARKQLVAAQSSIAVALDEIEETVAAQSDGFVEAASRTLSSAEGLSVDALAILEILRKLTSAKKIESLGEMLAEYELSISTVGGLLSAARRINYHEAERRGMTQIRVDGDAATSAMSVPSRLQKDILRLLYHAGNNTVRHSNPDAAKETSMEFKSRLADGKLMLSIWDDGVGMTGEKKKEVLEHRGGGLGIFDMIQICEANGWRFELASEKDKGTEVRITIDTSSWNEGAPSATGGSVASQLPSGGAALAGMMPAVASTFMMGAGFFAGMVPMIV